MTDNTEMMEQTIPESDVDMDEGLSSDDENIDGLDYWGSEEDAAAEENSAADSGSDEQDGEQETTEQTSEDEEMFPEELVVYGEKRQVKMSEAKAFIQKGLAFDRAKETWENRLLSAQKDPRLAFVDELAAAAGVDTATYMSNVRQQQKYGKLLETFGTLEDVPKDVLQMFTEQAKADKEKAAVELQTRQQAELDRKIHEEFLSFMENHPEVDKIPQEVAQLKVEGHSLEGAYAIFENKQLKEHNEKLERELAVLKQNNKNKTTNLPSSQSKGKKVSEADAWWN